MASSFPSIDVRRIRSWLFRLPLATRIIFLLLIGFYVATLFNPGLEAWGTLEPEKVGLQSRTYMIKPTTATLTDRHPPKHHIPKKLT